MVIEFDALGRKDARLSGRAGEVISTSLNMKNSAMKEIYSLTTSNAIIRH